MIARSFPLRATLWNRLSFTAMAALSFGLSQSQPASATTGPAITNVSFSPNPIPAVGTYVTVSATVTDASSTLNTPVLNEYNHYGNVTRTAPMTAGSGGTYSASIEVDPNFNNSATGESLTITASDTASNTAMVNVATQTYSNVPPSVTAIAVTPFVIPVPGGTVTVSAQVADPALGLTSVTLNEYNHYGNVTRTAPMTLPTNGLGDTYSASIPVDPNLNNSQNGESLDITATDPAGNQTTMPVATQYYSNTPPAITQVTFTPDPIPIAGATVAVSAVVTAAILPVASVVLNEYNHYGNITRTAPMVAGGGGLRFKASIPVDLNSNDGEFGEYLIIVATDTAGNQKTWNVATQGYSNSPPVGSLPILMSGNADAPVLSPSTTVAGSLGVSLTINGVNFASGAEVLFNGIALDPVSITSTQIAVNVPGALVAAAGSYAITVVTPSPGGGASNSVNFIVQ